MLGSVICQKVFVMRCHLTKVATLKKNFFFFFFVTVLALGYCLGFSLAAVSRGCCLVVVCGLIVAMASPCWGAWDLECAGFSICGSWPLEHSLSNCGT